MGTIEKGLIGEEDIELKDSGTSKATFTREDSQGRTATLTKLDAAAIQFRSLAKAIEDLIDGGYDVPIKPSKIFGGGSNTNGHTVPNIADDTFALLAAVQILTNKTLQAGTLTGTTTSEGPVEFSESGDEYFRLPRLTTTQRDNLTPANGMIIYNTTLNTMQVYEAGAWVNLSGSDVPIGQISAYGGSSAPSGWLLCDGSEVNRTTYADLFSAISTTFGTGDGSSTFNLPDLRGRFPLGADNMGGSSANRVTASQADNLGQGSGAEDHTLVAAEMPSHVHTIKQYYDNRIASSGGSETVHLPTGTSDTGSAGSDGAHNNMPPYQTVNYIIKY